MGAAPFDHTSPEHISRGEFQNVLDGLNRRLDTFDNRFEELAVWMKELNGQVGPVFKEYQDRKEDQKDEKQDKKDNKMAIIAFFSAIGSTVVSAVAIALFGFKN